jgi:hypothetical protein
MKEYRENYKVTTEKNRKTETFRIININGILNKNKKKFKYFGVI